MAALERSRINAFLEAGIDHMTIIPEHAFIVQGDISAISLN